MKSIIIAGIINIFVFVVLIGGVVAIQPTLSVAAFCVLPFAVFGLGFSVGRSGIRVVLGAEPEPPQRKPVQRRQRIEA